MIKAAIQNLTKNILPTRDEAYGVLTQIMKGEATDAQISAYITALRFVGETPDVIAGSAVAMREAATRVETKQERLVDTCGTGGDGANTFNISTTSAIVAAGAGVPVAKHGNRSVSSKSGSADVLAALGVDISVGPDVMTKCLDDIGIAFLFAPSLHPAMKYAIGPRREIGIRTIFNILGPLTNPAGARRGVLGVYNDKLVETLAQALASMGVDRYFVVHGMDGLDEITLTAPTQIAEVTADGVWMREVAPKDFGMTMCEPEALTGGEPEDNAKIVRAILSGEEQGPRREITLLNAAAAIAAGGLVNDLEDGVDLAKQSIDSGAALAKLDALVSGTSSPAG